MTDKKRQQQMIDYLTGEMTPEQRAEFQATLNGDVESHEELAALTQAMNAVTDSNDSASTADLEADIMKAVRKESMQANPQSQPHYAPSRWRVWGPIAVAAAVVMFVLLITDTQTHNGSAISSVAWADVVTAMNHVDHFHATAWADEPHNGNMPKMYKIDMYYRSPGHFRAQGFDQVQFRNGETSRIFDADERKWIEQQDTRFQLIPDQYIHTLEEKGMLDALLHMMFRGDPPQGKPVKSATVAASAGIEVFDYSHDATMQWARIWVLKESRLPIRMKLYQPNYEDFLLVTFDYTDPQPESFFDPDHFDEIIKQRNLYQVGQIMRAGAEKLEGKPVGLEQLYDPESGIQMPEFVAIESADSGDLLITAKHANNRKPNGGMYAPSYSEQLFDNWGNTYYRIAPQMYLYDDADEVPNEPLRMTYIAVPPFVQGEAQRTINLRYTVYERDADSGMMSDVLVGKQQVTIPEAAQAGIPHTWPSWTVLADPNQRREALYSYHLLRSPLWVQLNTLKSLEPLDTNGYQILRHYDLWDEYAKIFKRDRLDQALADPFSDWDTMNQLGQYLLHLHRTGRTGEFDSLYQQLKPLEDKFLTETERKDSLVDSYKKFNIKLTLAMAIPRATESLNSGFGPKVLSAARSNDGYTVIAVQTPADRGGNISNYWIPGKLPDQSTWKLINTAHDNGGREKPSVHTYLLEGDADQVQLDYSVVIMNALDDPESARSYNGDRFNWQQNIDLPSPKFDSLADLLKQYPDLAEQLEKQESPYQKLSDEINQCQKQGQYQQAIEAINKKRDLPRDAWPEYIRNDDMLYKLALENLDLETAKLQAKLGQFDQALATIDNITNNTTQPDYAHEANNHRWQFLLNTYAQIIDDLIAQQQYDRAEQVLDQLEAIRPDYRMYLKENVAIKVNNGAYGFTPTFKVWRTWQPIDIARLRLQQARTNQTLPVIFPPSPPGRLPGGPG